MAQAANVKSLLHGSYGGLFLPPPTGGKTRIGRYAAGATRIIENRAVP
jgi:hypothetical protein